MARHLKVAAFPHDAAEAGTNAYPYAFSSVDIV
jgi:hypothetical protein